MTFLPKVKTENAAMAQQAITPVMGIAVWFCKRLTNADVHAPMPIWMAPINAEALPALWPNGARESADELGNVKPWQHKKIKMRKMVLNNSLKPKSASRKSVMPVRLWQNNATLIICSLS